MSAYGTFDQSGNVWEWNDVTGAAGSSRGLRGGGWFNNTFGMSSSDRGPYAPSDVGAGPGFRLASPVANPSNVPEIDPAGFGSVASLLTGAFGLIERRRLKAKAA